MICEKIKLLMKKIGCEIIIETPNQIKKDYNKHI